MIHSESIFDTEYMYDNWIINFKPLDMGHAINRHMWVTLVRILDVI